MAYCSGESIVIFSYKMLVIEAFNPTGPLSDQRVFMYIPLKVCGMTLSLNVMLFTTDEPMLPITRPKPLHEMRSNSMSAESSFTAMQSSWHQILQSWM